MKPVGAGRGDWTLCALAPEAAIPTRTTATIGSRAQVRERDLKEATARDWLRTAKCLFDSNTENRFLFSLLSVCAVNKKAPHPQKRQSIPSGFALLSG